MTSTRPELDASGASMQLERERYELPNSEIRVMDGGPDIAPSYQVIIKPLSNSAGPGLLDESTAER
jgi:hypothetical protein